MQTNYTDTSVVSGTQYYYVVTAHGNGVRAPLERGLGHTALTSVPTGWDGGA